MDMTDAIKTVPVELVTRQLLVMAKKSDERDWGFQRNGLGHDVLFHTTGDIIDFIHELNGVPPEVPGVFDWDNIDDDLSDYIHDDIDLDECMRRYSVRLDQLLSSSNLVEAL